MVAVLFKKYKIDFHLLCIVLCQLTSIFCQLNIYNTDRTFKNNSLQFDCLNYRIYHETLVYQELSDVVDEIIPYCFRPVNISDELFEAFVSPHSHKLNFKQMYMANITAQRLLSWSIPIEVAERYQVYLDTPNSALNEDFFNCTEGQFGLRCQYSFTLGKGIYFDEIVEATFRGRIAYPESSDLEAQVPCYVLLSCHRNGQIWCLDWREICDGKIDCFDESLDEEFCFAMEINECDEDEYRCHNGLCISHDFWEDGKGDTDCLDRSDGGIEIPYINFCFQDPTFRCEEHLCRLRDKPFSCGDGQCVFKFEECHNGRHVLLIDSMVGKGNLTDECWMAMICLTALVKKNDEHLCQFQNNSVYAGLEQCESFFQFPITPVHSNHILFFYNDVHLRPNDDTFLLPDNICYNQLLCASMQPQFIYKNLTCLGKPKLPDLWPIIRDVWSELMPLIEQDFGSCLLSNMVLHNKINSTVYSLLYNCQNSSKLISKHRIMDGIIDCFEEDDEYYENSCLINDRYRIKCPNTTECWSPLMNYDACVFNDQEEISFQNFCDGKSQYFYDNKTQRHDDEVGCGDWSCNNIYTRCDGFWACSDGLDEKNCSRTVCSSNTYACISPVNHTLICLNSEQVKDDIADCLGAFDKPSFCRNAYPSKEISYPFRCPFSYDCLPISQLCDKNADCLYGEDEFCNNQQFTCDQDLIHNRSDVEEVICALKEKERHRIKYFAVFTSSTYPLLDKSSNTEFNHWPTQHYSNKNDNLSKFEDNIWPWHCNRGLDIDIWNKNDSNKNRTCICPPSYYGNLCQYQNQRVSLTIKLISNERNSIYDIIIMLINDNNEKQEIDSYDKYTYIVKQSCSIKLNRYLLFSTRPKNISKNYSVRIDIYEKNLITYIGSWYFQIDFLFLPVNRLGISLDLSNHLLEQHSSKCLIPCQNGQCIKYINKNKYLCRCYSQWTGISCNISLKLTSCQSCSSKSICIGSTINNQSICVCPIDRFGFKCQLKSKCQINGCQNNGQCIPSDISIPANNYTCICSNEYFGEYCQYKKMKLIVSLIDIDIPSYIIAYFYTLSNKSDPIETIILRKLSLFQDEVIFYLSIPYQLTFIEINNKYYLGVLQHSPKLEISTIINSKQECISVERLFNLTVLKIENSYKRIVHYHYLCYKNLNLICFIDKEYLCLCTNDHHANCFKFNSKNKFDCSLNNNQNFCLNNGKCLQDHLNCPSIKICLCKNCFYGNKCEYYGKGLGSTLDEILKYQFKRNLSLFKQIFIIKLSFFLTIILFLIGITNSILSIITFTRTKTKVGCGFYLFSSSIISLLIIILFTFKFLFLYLSYQINFNNKNYKIIFSLNCYIEPFMKLFLYLNNWFNACVAIERTISVFSGTNFNKKKSKKISFKIIFLLFILIFTHFIPQILHIHILHDYIEEKSWCVIKYISSLQFYTTIMIFIHYFIPLFINIFSIIFIIIITTKQISKSQLNNSFWIHLKLKIKKYRNILISLLINLILTLPHLIISIILDCNKLSNFILFYLIAYFLSFFPSTFIFFIFVLPSSYYRKEFHGFITYIKRRYQIFKINSLNLQ